VILRPARLEDAPALASLERAVVAEGRWFVRTPEECPAADELAARLRAIRRSPNGLWLVAEADGIVGQCTLEGGGLRRTRHVAALEVMVAPAARGHGLGRALVQRALDEARANPLLAKVCLAVFDDNEAALALYRRLGFTEEGRRPRHYVEPDGRLRGDVLMALDVG
jgi:RimJ/RimL family protein N-acetyltransferase